MRARISKNGAKILQNTKVANALLYAIIENKEKLMSGETVQYEIKQKDANSEVVVDKGEVSIVSASCESQLP